MKFIKTTALLPLLMAFIITACEKEAEVKKVNLYVKNGIILSGAQNVPISATSGTGTMDVNYDKRLKTLNYKVTWSQLSGSPNGMSVYGLAPAGYVATSPGIIQVITTTGFTASGSFSGSLLADGVLVKEEDLLNGLYYIAIRTVAYPGGEIRGQVRFQ